MWLGCAVMAAVLWAGCGLPGLLLGRRSMRGQYLATTLGLIASTIGLAAAFAVMLSHSVQTTEFRGILPDSAFHLRLDALSGFFLVPIFLIGAMGSIYGLGYWPQNERVRTGRKLNLFYGLLIGAMAMVVLAGDGVLFLFAWEVMALAAFFLVSTEDQKKDVREAGWLYLLATHAGTLILFALFALLRVACGSFELRPIAASHAGLGLRAGILLTALAGFGFKAGVMPLHFWLPAAHANAPTHVSAILSGVVLKMGIYGLLRTLMLIPVLHGSWGVLVLLLGSVSTLLGVLFALGQHDLKRLLAYHSIENIGIILMGLGLAMIGQARGRPEWIVLGMAGCLLHVWNHSLFKSLLFFSAGAVIQQTHTREIDRMGGLAKSMPLTAMFFLVGAIAICGLPPLNGFVSELFIYLGLLGTLKTTSIVALAAPLLAMAGALALACFVKAFGAVFLGTLRTSREVHEARTPLIMAMSLVALACVVIGLLPVLVARPLDNVIRQWSNQSLPSIGTLAPVSVLTLCSLLLGISVAGVAYLLRNSQNARRLVTWDCGYARPDSRMQYTSSSFAQMIVGIFSPVLRPRKHDVRIEKILPDATAFQSHVDDLVLDRLLRPAWQRVRFELARLRFIQQGSVQRYLFYILLILFLLLLTSFPIVEMFRRLVAEAS